MPLYRQRLAEIDAIQFVGWNTDGVAEWAGPHARVEAARITGPGRSITEGISIRTVDGAIWIRPSEWVIRRDDRFDKSTPEEFAELWEPSPDRGTGPVYDQQET